MQLIWKVSCTYCSARTMSYSSHSQLCEHDYGAYIVGNDHAPEVCYCVGQGPLGGNVTHWLAVAVAAGAVGAVAVTAVTAGDGGDCWVADEAGVDVCIIEAAVAAGVPAVAGKLFCRAAVVWDDVAAGAYWWQLYTIAVVGHDVTVAVLV